ncbi:MAG: hypothetical protein ACE5KH_01680 [Candidatus Geothermarchaeales archaeon]
MMSDARKYLTLGVMAVLAGVLVVVYAPAFAPEGYLSQSSAEEAPYQGQGVAPPVERAESENVDLLSEALTVSAQQFDILLLLLLPLALAGASYAILRNRE